MIKDSRKTFEIRDAEVEGLRVTTKRNHSGGIVESLTHSVGLRLAGGKVVEMRFTVQQNQDPSLAVFLDRLTELLYERCKRILADGRTVSGNGWTLSKDGFHFESGRTDDALIPGELTACDVFDDHLCIWVRGRERPYAKIPWGSENVAILKLLLCDRLASRKSDKEESPPDSLGRILFERKPDESFIVPWGFAVVTFGFGLIAGVAFSFWAGLVLILFSIGIVASFAKSQYSSFRCHEHGVCKVHWRGADLLRYEDVEAFTFAAVRHFVNGGYTGTTLSLKFEPMLDKPGKRLAYNATVQGVDEELERLREHISGVIAARMARDLSKEREVRWTPHLRFLAEGIEYQPKGFLGRKKPLLIPLGEVMNFELREGVFHLWVKGKQYPVVQEEVSASNFFPGFVLLASIFRPPQPE